MNVDIQARAVEFSEGGLLAGRYVLDDRFKPHFAVLNSPSGHNVTMVSPADHRHHKGLMYALRCADLNFWEEEPGSGACGVQEIMFTTLVSGGFVQELLWRGDQGGLETYREVRTITFRALEGGNAFEWRWHTRRESLRDHRLVKSPWSVRLPDGRTVNYHGLGLRLPWSWAYPHETVAGVEMDGRPADALMGSTAPSATMWGLMDGEWAARKCAVTIRQDGRNAWFVLRQPFAYLAVGPSNAEECDVRKGDAFEEIYTITVADR